MFATLSQEFLFGFLKLYVEVCLSLSILAVATIAARPILNRCEPRSSLRVLYAAMVLAIAMPVVFCGVSKDAFPRPAVQVFSGTQRDPGTAARVSSDLRLQPRSFSSDAQAITLSRSMLESFLYALFAWAIWVGVCLSGEALRTQKLARSLPVWRSLGRVRVHAADSLTCPFAFFSFPRLQAHIVIPSAMLSNTRTLLMTVRHEACHLRQGDPLWLYVVEFVRRYFGLSPLLGSLAAQVVDLQEFACDAHVVGHPRYSPRAYGRCLYEAAQSAVHSPAVWVGTTHMAVERNGHPLKRRIEMILSKDKPKQRVPKILACGLLFSVIATAVLATSAIQGKKLTLEQANQYAKAAREKSGLPIEANDLVLSYLNRFLSTAEGRKRTVESFARLPQYEAMIAEVFKRYNVPTDLVALALYESGLRNDLISTMKARGIWQFIPATARRYGLMVTDRVDERLDPTKETRAAAEYLRDLYKQFGDWRLAIKAYNEGESKVARLIEQHGTRDPWTLERLDSSEGYLSGAMAKMVLYHNRELFL